MNRPNVSAMNDIEAIIRKMEDLRTTLGKLKDELQELPAKMGQEISDPAERLEAARYLYWMVPEVPSTVIGAGILGVNVYEMNRLLGPQRNQVQCEQCQSTIEFRSRSHLQSVVGEMRKYRKKGSVKYSEEGFTVLCDACQEALHEVWVREYEAECAERTARLEELAAMSYDEYLQTPEWLWNRQQHLELTNFRCQVCNKNRLLEVYHRSHRNRGQEGFSELIALCKKCHDLLQKESRLAKE
ncbi:MAG: hypothetical protein K1Y36_30470 [Blastocatellia bacterium]|nr:hypothetical protein [Blastocatellia bacterium]